MADPLVSFVVMCYRTEQYVAECINAILAQNAPYEWEIIAVDDCSPDRTFDVLQEFRDPRLRAIRHSRNLGHTHTIETGLRAASGKYIARIDSDDRHRPEFLRTMVPILEAYPEVIMAYADAALMNAAGQITASQSDRHHEGRDFKGNELVRVLATNCVCAPTVIARREAWLEHLPVPSHLAFSDWYFSLLMAQRGEFYYRHQVLADYRVHPGNMHSRTIVDRTEERSIEWMLNRIYSQKERDSAIQHRKHASRRSVYAEHYELLATKYFGAQMAEDARRCYSRALKYRPERLLSPRFARRFAGVLLGLERYEALKTHVKAVLR